MIVLDEHLNDERIVAAIAKWYKGKIIHLKDLRPYTVIEDDAIASILLQQKRPTFVTLNYVDFWRKMAAHPDYCVVCFKLSLERKLEIPDRLRDLFYLADFKTQRKRMGKIISVTDSGIEHYE